MKYKCFLLIVISFLTAHIGLAQYIPTKIINSPNIYFKLTGNAEIDTIIINSFRNYWKINHFIPIPADVNEKDVKLVGNHGNAPIFLFINTIQVNTPGFVNCIAIVYGNHESEFGRKSFDPSEFLSSQDMYYPSDKVNLLDIDYEIPLAIRQINDRLISEKEHKDRIENPSVLKKKTLLIPEELTNKILPSENLKSYKFKYEVVPNSKIKTIANDPSENSQYCCLASIGSAIFIYDLETKECVLSYYCNSFKIKDEYIQKISDEVATEGPHPVKEHAYQD